MSSQFTELPIQAKPITDFVAVAEGHAQDASADAAQTALDRIATGEDATATAADRVQTGLDRTATGEDATATAADRVQTGLDRVATGEDATATAADRVQTGLDATAAGDAASLAEAWAEGIEPGGVGTNSAKGWAVVAADSARLEIGTVTTLDAGDPATAQITGDPGEQILNLGIPEGEKGEKGDKGDPGDGSGDMLAATYDPTNIAADAFARANHTGTQTLATISDAGDAASLDVGTTAGTVAAGDDARLSDARGWTASTVSEAEAEAGTATTRRAWTAQRVRQAILGWWNGSADKTKLDGIEAEANDYTHPNHTGHVTSDGDGATTIANGVVTNAMLAEAGPNIVKGVSGAAGPVTDVFLPPPSVLGRGSTGGLLGLGIGAGLEVADDEIRAANEMALRDRATTAQIRGFTGDAGVTTERLADAAALIAPSGASNWAPDWAAFVNAEWVVTANRTLSNPTNVIPGTTRTAIISASDTTERTIAFGANYFGPIGDMPTVASNKRVLLTLYAVTASIIVMFFLELDP